MGLLIITTLPSILILMYFVKGDKFPEPQDKILKTFFWGLAICLPAYIGNTLLFEVYRDLGISNILSSSFFGPAIVEEGLKFLVFLNGLNLIYAQNLVQIFDTVTIISRQKN